MSQTVSSVVTTLSSCLCYFQFMLFLVYVIFSLCYFQFMLFSVYVIFSLCLFNSVTSSCLSQCKQIVDLSSHCLCDDEWFLTYNIMCTKCNMYGS